MSNVLETIWVKSAAYSTSPAEIDALINAEFAGVDGVVAYVLYRVTHVDDLLPNLSSFTASTRAPTSPSRTSTLS